MTTQLSYTHTQSETCSVEYLPELWNKVTLHFGKYGYVAENHTRTHTRARTHTHARTRAHTHTHTHARTRARACVYIYKAKQKSSPITGLDRPWGFQEVEAPRFQDIRHTKVVRLSALRTGRLYPLGNISGTHFC